MCVYVCMYVWQVMVIEYARNVLALPDAHSTEFDPSSKNPVVVPTVFESSTLVMVCMYVCMYVCM